MNKNRNLIRKDIQKIKDFLTFPIRAVSLFEYDRWGLSSLASERFDYVVREVQGYCLDVGCGRYNRFINDYLNGDGVGIDVFPYEGLTDDQILIDMSHFPFDNESFYSVTFIANLNHIHPSLRDAELAEAFRCLRYNGNVIITMGNPLAEIIIHKVVKYYDWIFKTNHDMDSQRGMTEEEDYYVTSSEIYYRLKKIGFKDISRKSFLTQWNLNHLYIGWKRHEDLGQD